MFDSFIPDSVKKIKAQIGNGHAVIGLSGGVDSSVATMLVAQAVGQSLTAIFVDTGFMRKGEPELVKKTFSGKYGLDFRLVDARDEFIGVLNGVSPSVAKIQKGECPITIQWDFDALSAKYQNPDMNLQVVIPSDSTVAGMYIQFIT